MKAGLCTIALQKLSVFDAIDAAKKAGAEAVEIWGKPPHMPYPIDMDHCARIRAHAAGQGIVIAAYGSYLNAGNTVEINGVTLTAAGEVSIARALGAPCMRIWPGKKEQKDSTADDIDAVIAAIRSIGDAASAANITVVLERHCGTITSAWGGIDDLMRRIAHPSVHLNYQIPYPASADEYDTRSVRDYTSLLAFAKHIHLQNYIRDTVKNPKRTSLADGIVDYSRFGAAAAAAGYRGYAMIEFLPDNAGHDGSVLLENDIRYIKSL